MEGFRRGAPYLLSIQYQTMLVTVQNAAVNRKYITGVRKCKVESWNKEQAPDRLSLLKIIQPVTWVPTFP